MPSDPMTDTSLIYKDNTPDLRFELYRGRLVQQSIPTNIKNKICQFLLFKLQQYFSIREDLELITLFNVGVRTGLDTSRVPDLMVCPQELWSIVGDRPGAAVLNFGEIPVLAIEVQENRADYLLKKAEYALIEIPEVWMVDPEQRRVRIWTNPTREDGYVHKDYFGEDQITSEQFPDLDLTVDDILNPPSYAQLMQEEVDLNVHLQDGFSEEWQQLALARTENEELREKYRELEEVVHNELQEKAVLLELLEEKGIDLKSELSPGEFAMLQDDIAARELKKENETLSEQLGDETLSEEVQNEVIEAAVATYETELHRN